MLYLRSIESIPNAFNLVGGSHSEKNVGYERRGWGRIELCKTSELYSRKQPLTPIFRVIPLQLMMLFKNEWRVAC